MKKAILFFSVYTLMIIVATTAHAEWIQYDNFDSEYIDGSKWAIQSLSAYISVENGKAKFQHLLTIPNASSYLIPKKDIEKIRGVKFTVIFDSCTLVNPSSRDVSARVVTFLGFDEDNYLLFPSFSLDPYFQNKDTSEFIGQLILLDMSQGATYVAQPFWGHFYHGILAEDVMGISYVFTMEWTKKHIKFTLEGQGEIKYTWEKAYKVTEIVDSTKAFVGIGTRSSTYGPGFCTFYFDDVYLNYENN